VDPSEISTGSGGARPPLPAPGIRSRATSMLADAVHRQTRPDASRPAEIPSGSTRFPRVLHPEIQAILDEMNAMPGPPAHEVSVAEARAGHEAETARLCGAGDPVAEVRDLTVPGAGGDVPVRLFIPDGAAGVVAYIHGGGWMMGTVASYDAPLRRLANASGAIVAAVEYRLSPEHRFPAALDDSLAAIRLLAAEFAGEPLAIAGDSAGGNLAAVCALRLRGELELRLQALIYPVTDAALNRPSHREFGSEHGLSTAQLRRCWSFYLDGADGGQPDASPLRADLAGAPPAYVLTAEEDILRDEGEAYAEALRAAGVPVELVRWPGTIHGFFRWLAATSVAGEAVDAVAAALRHALSVKDAPVG
jgi:acetyl esterase